MYFVLFILLWFQVVRTEKEVVKNQRMIHFSLTPKKPYWDYEDDLGYQWTVIEEDIDTIEACRSYKCAGNLEQTVCLPVNVSSRCSGFSILPLDFNIEKNFVIGHNVLRNRVAKSQLFVKNMNYLVRKPVNS